MAADATDSILRHVLTQGLSPSGRQEPDAGESLEPHLLVPLSSHSMAGAGLDFLSHFFEDKSSVRLTLMHIPPSQAAVWVEETSYESLNALEAQAAQCAGKGRRVVDDARRRLLAAGFDPERIEGKVAPHQMGKAHDIIREAREGRYDAVVLGRRVQTGLEDVFDQSICRELIESLTHAISFPLWLCRLPEKGRRDVLLCVDGSDPSDRMADHVGYMLARSPGHRVTVFHVHDPSKSAPLDAEAILGHAVDVLLEAGVPLARIGQMVRRGASPARLIEEEYASGSYAAVAIGSAGADRGFWNKLLVGSVAQALFKKLRGAALWVCY
ncbi:universal stress protein [Salidesulfovibrio onnuriiensis]|uniref:universal stress protein n=1 Tax=Salidesulfovibrio onnuriiensis TaxID=2583823 RepID=UPI0011C7D406|nr:universal stress protein [Salidesulfovibrio onnuriiensis]